MVSSTSVFRNFTYYIVIVAMLHVTLKGTINKIKSFGIQKLVGKNLQLLKYQKEIIFRAEKLINLVNGEEPVEDAVVQNTRNETM